MKDKFWEFYRKALPIEIMVGMWFVTPVLTLFVSNNGGLALGMTVIVIAATLLLENGYNNYVRNK